MNLCFSNLAPKAGDCGSASKLVVRVDCYSVVNYRHDGICAYRSSFSFMQEARMKSKRHGLNLLNELTIFCCFYCIAALHAMSHLWPPLNTAT